MWKTFFSSSNFLRHLLNRIIFIQNFWNRSFSSSGSYPIITSSRYGQSRAYKALSKPHLIRTYRKSIDMDKVDLIKAWTISLSHELSFGIELSPSQIQDGIRAYCKSIIGSLNFSKIYLAPQLSQCNIKKKNSPNMSETHMSNPMNQGRVLRLEIPHWL